MGEVYRAWDPQLEREIAIKVLREGAGGTGDSGRRFVQEAKAASALSHPNVAHVYEIGTQDDIRFIAMELIDGETLRHRIGFNGALPVDEVLAIATQITSALAAAHEAGIIHRDIKPENIMIRRDGYAKILDFGLAKLREGRGEDMATVVKTKTGIAMGTLQYMAPEQLSGGEITPAADVYSLGAVLHEMVTGKRAFDGNVRSGVPPKLEAVIAKAMSPEPRDRYPNARALDDELRLITRENKVSAPVPVKRKGLAAIVAIALIIAVISAGTWMYLRQRRVRNAETMAAEAQKLFDSGALPEAYEAAIAATAVLPNDDRVRSVISQAAESAVIESDPPGATVYLERFKGPAQRVRAGTTPLTIERLPRADYRVTIEKPGYAPVVRSLSLTPLLGRGFIIPARSGPLRVRLTKADAAPEGMVAVDGGEYRLTGWARPTDRSVLLRDFWIDRYEVSNREFEEFVRAGGYRNRALWKHPVADNGKTLSFEEAMARFRDTTGLPGPRNWSGGAPPADRENHPVTGVTWYEASAFAEWKGKRLPTIFQWHKAGRHLFAPRANGTTMPWGIVDEGVDVTERANFSSKGTMPVDSMPFGISPWGAHHAAGNVAEWCLNEMPPGRLVLGGGWNDAVYAYGKVGAYPAMFSNDTIGFRCVKEAEAGGDDQGGFALARADYVPVFNPVGDAEFEEIRRAYDYPKEPLDARVTEVVKGRGWRRERIEMRVAGRIVPAYLYLPTGFKPPYQVIHFSPAGDVASGLRPVTVSTEAQLEPLIRNGRAIFTVVLEGYLGRPRPADFVYPDPRDSLAVEYVVQRVTELRRGLDYLESRPDIDRAKIAFYGPSAGSAAGVILTAVEDRYRSVLFSGTGLSADEIPNTKFVNRIHFVPRIAPPKLMLQGRYDEDALLKSRAEPMFKLMTEPKRLTVFEGGHIPSAEIFIPTAQAWLDGTLGPVN